jgi:alkanesulfonate monooxygenase SsuD/methylene tetrahydromethanopterin reductase-like flavin-dependent oxidoreductase (luciferase family)
MFEEALELLQRGLAGESIAHRGRYYTLPEVPLRIRPLQRPHPPLWYGTGSSHRNHWAAEHDVNLLCLVPNARAGEVFADYREKLGALGKLGPKAPFWGLARQVIVAPTDAEAERIGERAWKRLAQSFNWLVDHLGREAFPIAQTFAGGVEMGLAFAGSPASVRDWVARAREEAGITYMALEIAFGDISEAEAGQSAELFAREVMPAFAAS